MRSVVSTLNLDYRCNERCVFCAADLGGTVPAAVRRPSLTLERVARWFGDDLPGPDDRVIVSGGEPTLHRELLPIVRHVSGARPDVVLFTNGMRLEDPALARATAEAGVTRYEISLYGPDAASHDAITCVPGSFDRTMAGLRTLACLRREHGIWVSVRLLVARHTVAGNPAVIRRVAEEVGCVDSFSVNQLVRSQDALDVDAPISWAEAGESINGCVRVARDLGHEIDCAPVPLCVFDEDTREWAIDAATVRAAEHADHVYEYRYLDPLLPVDAPSPRRRAVLPDVCLGCAVAHVCGRVERGYLLQFGQDGLRTVTLPLVPS